MREAVDTNILLYAHDDTAGDKHWAAESLLERLVASGELVLSAQVLNEFYANATRPNKPPGLSHEIAREVLVDLAAACEVVALDAGVTLRALEVMSRASLSFWDALIWAAAAESGVSVVYSEDFQHGQVIDGVRFCNPFV